MTICHAVVPCFWALSPSRQTGAPVRERRRNNTCLRPTEPTEPTGREIALIVAPVSTSTNTPTTWIQKHYTRSGYQQQMNTCPFPFQPCLLRFMTMMFVGFGLTPMIKHVLVAKFRHHTSTMDPARGKENNSSLWHAKCHDTLRNSYSNLAPALSLSGASYHLRLFSFFLRVCMFVCLFICLCVCVCPSVFHDTSFMSKPSSETTRHSSPITTPNLCYRGC